MQLCRGILLTTVIGCSTQTKPITWASDAGAETSDVPVDAALPEECNDPQALSLFERKIEPLFSDDHPSSCSQCHLPGVDLQAFARDTACETYACLAQQGLIDEQEPNESLVLSWIGRAEPDSELITQQVIQQELGAFSQWLTHVSNCRACEGATCGDQDKLCEVEPEPLRGIDPTEVDPGGCEPPKLEALFRDAVYVYRGRCSPCHINDHEDPETPMWIEARFDCVESLTRTFNNVQQNGYIDFSTPDQSLLLLKPLSESAGGVVHGGGPKFDGKTDPAYVSFKHFIDRLVACQDGGT